MPCPHVEDKSENNLNVGALPLAHIGLTNPWRRVMIRPWFTEEMARLFCSQKGM